MNLEPEEIKTFSDTKIENTILSWDVCVSLSKLAQGEVKTTRVQKIGDPNFICHQKFCHVCMCNI